MKVSIETRAVKALAQWKTTFADEVSEQAKLIAAQGGSPDRVTLQHYQQAAPAVMQSLMAAIATDQTADANQKAA